MKNSDSYGIEKMIQMQNRIADDLFIKITGSYANSSFARALQEFAR